MTDNKKVISLELSERWSLWDFVSPPPAERNAIDDWYRKTLSKQAQADFDTLLRGLAKTGSPDKWPGWRGYLRGEQAGLWEVGFKANKRQYRVIGMMGRGRKQALLLIGCYHKQARYVPDGTLKTAIRRKQMLENGEASLNERKV